jgi:hypothetical protein
MSIPVISSTQTDANSPINETLMEGLRQRSTYTPIGTILPWYDYNGLVSMPEGFMQCTGQIINEANYNTEHGAGTWTSEVGISQLDGKYTPNLTGKYLSHGSSTQSGNSAITSVGNSGNTVNLEHAHNHNHNWLDIQLNYSSSDDRQMTYDASGNSVALSIGGFSQASTYRAIHAAKDGETGGAIAQMISSDTYTDNDATNTLSTTQSIRPETIECKFIIRII